MGASQSTRKITLVNDDKAGVIKLSESLAYRLRGQIEGQQLAAAAAEPPPPPPPPPTPVTVIPQVPEPPTVPQVSPEPIIPESLVPEPQPAAEPLVTEATGGVDVTPELISVPEVGDVTTNLKLPDAAVEPQSDGGVTVRSEPPPSVSQPGVNIVPWSSYAEEANLMVMRLKEEKEQELQQLKQEWREKMEAREQEFIKMSRLSEEEVNGAIKEVEKLFVKASCSPVCQDHQDAVRTCYQDHPRQALRCSRQVEDFARCVDLSRLQSLLRQRAN